MKVSLKWLSDYVEVPQDIKEFCDRLDLTGTGVEGVERTGDVFDGVVVGHVLTCVDHPDSDHMHVTTCGRACTDRMRRSQHRCWNQGSRCNHRCGASRRLQDQEVEAARRYELRHVLLSARTGHGQRARWYMGASR